MLTHNLPRGTRLYFLPMLVPGARLARIPGQPAPAGQEHHAAGGVKPPPKDTWRPSYLDKLLKQRQHLHSLGLNVKEGRVQELIDSLCVN